MSIDVNHPDNIENISKWVSEYYAGYSKYMSKHHAELYQKFRMNIFPPQQIGGCIGIMQGAIHSDEDYTEIMNITNEFCEQYPNPIDFPKEF